MRALAEHTALGSGFQIAMRDLEIRGAGDLLGGEQSGFINDIGFDTYQKILNESIEELKIEHFQELYPELEPTQKRCKSILISKFFSRHLHQQRTGTIDLLPKFKRSDQSIRT